MTTDLAPERRWDEDPGAFIVRLAEWLAEPQRRRMGDQSVKAVKQAVGELQGTRPPESYDIPMF